MPHSYHEPRIKVPRFSEAEGFYTTPERSKQMGKIRGRNTQPELRLRRALWKAGLRYRLHAKDLPGKPDIVLRKYRLVIFIDGAFWHGYDWARKREQIKSNRAFWIPKIERNQQRDREINAHYARLGWKVLRFWDHEVKQELGACLHRILQITSLEYW